MGKSRDSPSGSEQGLEVRLASKRAELNTARGRQKRQTVGYCINGKTESRQKSKHLHERMRMRQRRWH